VIGIQVQLRINHAIYVISVEELQLLWQRRQQWFSEKSISSDAFSSILNNHSIFEKDKWIL